MNTGLIILFGSISLTIFSAANEEELHTGIGAIVPDKAIVDNMINIKKLRVKKTGKASFKVSGNFEIKEDLSQDAVIQIKFYELKDGGDWVEMKENVLKKNICELMGIETGLWPDVVRKSNFPAKCPIKRDKYKVDGAELKFTDVVARSKRGCYRIVVQLEDGKGKALYGSSTYIRVAADNDELKCLN